MLLRLRLLSVDAVVDAAVAVDEDVEREDAGPLVVVVPLKHVVMRIARGERAEDVAVDVDAAVDAVEDVVQRLVVEEAT